MPLQGTSLGMCDFIKQGIIYYTYSQADDVKKQYTEYYTSEPCFVTKIPASQPHILSSEDNMTQLCLIYKIMMIHLNASFQSKGHTHN